MISLQGNTPPPPPPEGALGALVPDESWNSLSSKKAISSLGDRFAKLVEEPADRFLLQAYRGIRCQGLLDLFRSTADACEARPHLLSCRIKRIDTIIRKLRRMYPMKLGQMDDIIGFRIITPSLAEQETLVVEMNKKLPVRRIRSYVEKPALSGYRAIHLIVNDQVVLRESRTPQLFTCEVQVRTYYQHLWATTSESFGEQAKEGGGTEQERSYLLELSQRIREKEKNAPHEHQIRDLGRSKPVSFFVVHFDKSRGTLLTIDPFDLDLEAAIRQMTYLEELHRHDMGRESVLIGISATKDELKITHLRYFRPYGVPDLPDFLKPGQPRPARIELQ